MDGGIGISWLFNPSQNNSVNSHTTNQRVSTGRTEREVPYTFDIFNLISGFSHAVLHPNIITNTEKHNKHCMLFYVYGWFFGLGLSIIAAIYCFVQNDNVISRATMFGAVILSIGVAVLQIALNTCARNRVSATCRKETSSVIQICGLVLIMIAILAGTFTSDEPGGLFFLCAIFSFACYLMACIGFSVRYWQERKNHSRRMSNSTSTGNERREASLRGHDNPGLSEINVGYLNDGESVQVYPEVHPEYFSSSAEPLPILNLPSYSEAIRQSVDSMRPPEYSIAESDIPIHITSSMPSSQEHALPVPERGDVESHTDLPPEYQEVVQERFGAL